MKNLIFSVLIAFVSIVTLSSCDKEYVEPIEHNSLSKKKVSFNKDGGGDDDDLIIIYGLTENTSSSPITGAQVVILESATSIPIDTMISDSQGEFEFEVETGTYFFKACAVGYQNLVTGNYTFNENDNLTLTLEE